MVKQYQDLYSLIEACEKIVIFTGAGISTESGIPDFRGPSGFWKTNKPVYFQDFVSSQEARRIAWERKFNAEKTFNKATPNEGHLAIAHIINRKNGSHLITQNIDNLHQDSGVSSRQITEIHGNASYAKCLSCQKRYELASLKKYFIKQGIVPNCMVCGGLIKTATISFGQPMPEEEMRISYQKIISCELFISIGTSLQVYPAAGLPKLAKENGANLVIINNEPTPLDHLADLVIHDQISDVFKELKI